MDSIYAHCYAFFQFASAVWLIVILAQGREPFYNLLKADATEQQKQASIQRLNSIFLIVGFVTLHIIFLKYLLFS